MREIKNAEFGGERPLCYAHDLVVEDCAFDTACDRVFGYSSLRADIRGFVTNIKNPMSGRIGADSIGSVTIDEDIKASAGCVIDGKGGRHEI